ncbi:MAG: hypothetical protein SPM31_01655 [Prevotella sp.]|nr:hypothetical protein [Prevotella sp.]
MFKKSTAVMLLFSLTAVTAHAGGLLTNTNQNISFNRNFAREGTIGIDGVYSNPAGVSFLTKGFHLSLNVQNVYQTRDITSSITVPTLQGTPFYQPFKLNGGDDNGEKCFRGKASVPVLPSFQAAMVYDKWTLQAGFALAGGGGKAIFNNGLPSFERQISLVPAILYGQGLTSQTPSYSVRSNIKGQQYDFGLQLGVSYKVNDHIAVYGGARFNYIYNKYVGNITDISANINGENVKLHDYFDTQAQTYDRMAFYYRMRASEMTDGAAKAKFETAAQQAQAGADKMNQTKELFADKYLDCTQNGWGITPIIGIDYKAGRWNIGARYEFTTKFNIENDTKVDNTGLFADGVNTHNDLPGLLAVGTQYEILKNLRAMVAWHYYFDKDARMDHGKQKALSGNTQEYLAGMEWDVAKGITLSAGGQRTKYGLGDGTYLSDMSFVTSSYSIGFGAKVKIAKNMSLNVAYFWTDYEKFHKEYDQTITGAGQSAETHNTDVFTRSNKVVGVGLDIDL